MSPRIVPVLIFTALVSAQTERPGTVDGIVTNSVTGQPVKRATVLLRRAGEANAATFMRPPGEANELNAVTDSTGKFHFEGVVPGRYVASAEAEGYAPNVRTPRTQKLVTLAEQQQVTGIAIEAIPLGVIAGRVTDDAGQPLQGLSVMPIAANGRRIMPGGFATTDDRGRFRLIDLQPGGYYVKVTPPQTDPPRAAPGVNVHRLIREESYGETYYPGVSDFAQASVQIVKPGAELTADFRLRKLPVYHIRGRLTGAVTHTTDLAMQAHSCNDRLLRSPFTGDPVVAQFASIVMLTASGHGGAVEPNGRFDIPGLVTGEYCLTALSGNRRIAGPSVTVKDSSVSGVELDLPPAFTLHGTVTLEGPALPETPSLVVGILLDGNLITQTNMEDGVFHIPDLMPGPYGVLLIPRPAIYVKSIWYGSQDISSGIIPMAQEGVPLNIKLGTDPGDLSVAISLGNLEPGTPVAVAAVPEIAFAGRSDLRRFGNPAADGKVVWNGMAPGRYKVIAIESGDLGDLQDLDLLKLLDSQSVAVTVEAGAHESAVVTVIPAVEVEKAKEKLR